MISELRERHHSDSFYTHDDLQNADEYTLFTFFFSKVNCVKSVDKGKNHLTALFLYFKFFIQVTNKSGFIDVGLMTF